MLMARCYSPCDLRLVALEIDLANQRHVALACRPLKRLDEKSGARQLVETPESRGEDAAASKCLRLLP